MKFHELNTAAKKSRKRVGRGVGSGHGKTAGRGTKGQNARTGGGVRPGFEGGQNPLMKRLPKTRGFKQKAKDQVVVHTDALNRFRANTKVTKTQLHEQGLIGSPTVRVKLLHRGAVDKSLTVTVDAYSKQAAAAIEAAGGSITRVA